MSQNLTVGERFQQERDGIAERLRTDPNEQAVNGALRSLLNDETFYFPMTVVTESHEAYTGYEAVYALDVDPARAEYFADLSRSGFYRRLGSDVTPPQVLQLGRQVAHHANGIMAGMERVRTSSTEEVVVPNGFCIFRYDLTEEDRLRHTWHVALRATSFKEAVAGLQDKLCEQRNGVLFRNFAVALPGNNTWQKVRFEHAEALLPRSGVCEATFTLTGDSPGA